MKCPYSEGTIFLVPLRNGGYARGVVARKGRQRTILFGYFFGPRLESGEAAITGYLDPTSAILRIRFGALGLRNGQWRILGKISNWKRTDWPMPDFIMRDPLGKIRPRLVRYSDENPAHVETEYPIDDNPALAPAGLAGHGAVEIRLTKLLAS